MKLEIRTDSSAPCHKSPALSNIYNRAIRILSSQIDHPTFCLSFIFLRGNSRLRVFACAFCLCCAFPSPFVVGSVVQAPQ